MISSQLFDAYLKCPTKGFLQFKGELGENNSYAGWVQTRELGYLERYLKTTAHETTNNCVSQTSAGKLMNAKWHWGSNLLVSTPKLETVIQVMERVPSIKRNQPIQFIPARLTLFNKLSEHNRLRLTFDCVVLSEMLGRKINLGKIIYGDNYNIWKTKTDILESQVRKLISEINRVISAESSPDLILGRHCNECEFKTACKQKAIENDDLSLLANISEKERNKLNGKGISTIKHLSYDFKPRRKSKRVTGVSEKYYNSLKALAIRQHKIHVNGRDELKIKGTPVYLDIEGIPDRDFYYLIGVRIKVDKETIQHSLWAETQADEKIIWNKFIEILSEIDDPIIIHYGSFEKTFLKQMYKRYGGPEPESIAFKAINNPLNLLSFIYARVYFPTYSNGLKEIANYLGFNWKDADASGIRAIMWRIDWEQCQESLLKQKLLIYNANDCEALDYVTVIISQIMGSKIESNNSQVAEAVNVDSLPREGLRIFHKNQFCITALEEINRTAYWDYQHEKILLRTNKRLKTIVKVNNKRRKAKTKVNEVIQWPPFQSCPECGNLKFQKHQKYSKDIFDIRFGKSNIKRWVTHYIYYRYKCTDCGAVFSSMDQSITVSKYGPNLVTFVTYLIIEMRISYPKIATFINKLFGFNLSQGIVNRFKAQTATVYNSAFEKILQKIISGKLVHADETKMSVGGKTGYVWAFANMENVAYIYNPSREGELVRDFAEGFQRSVDN